MSAEGMRLQLSPLRVLKPQADTRKPLALVIACLADRLEVLQTDRRVPVGFLPELVEDALSYLREYEKVRRA